VVCTGICELGLR